MALCHYRGSANCLSPHTMLLKSLLRTLALDTLLNQISNYYGPRLISAFQMNDTMTQKGRVALMDASIT